MGSPFAVGLILGVAFGAFVMGVAAWLFRRQQQGDDHARIVAIARYEAHRAAREKVEELIIQREYKRATKMLKPPMEDRPTRVHP